MATNSTSRPLQIIGGVYTEVPATTTSAGVADAQKIPALNAAGVLDATILNSTITSAGAADSGKIVALDASGHVAVAMMPTGIGPEVSTIVASEAIAGGAWINIWNNAGAFNVRNADATVAGKAVDGFVLVGGAAAASLQVYTHGINTGVTGQTPGAVYLQKTPGTGGPASVTGVGAVSQRIGTATAATSVVFSPTPPCTLAA